MAEVFANPLAELAEYTDMKQDMVKEKDQSRSAA